MVEKEMDDVAQLLMKSKKWFFCQVLENLIFKKVKVSRLHDFFKLRGKKIIKKINLKTFHNIRCLSLIFAAFQCDSI